MIKPLLTILLMSLLSLTGLALAQDAAVYDDPEGRFIVPIPEGWTAETLDGAAHFANVAGTMNVYVLAVPATEASAGIQAALQQVFPDFSAEPVQTNAAPLPNGTTWQQEIYLVDGEVVAALGRVVNEATAYVLIGRAAQDVFAAENNHVLQLLMGIEIAEEATIEIPPADYVDQSSFTEREVTIESGEWSLPGILAMPQGEGPFPAVVLVHGSGPNDRDETIGVNKPFRDLAWGLASNGIAVLRYDKRSFVYGRASVEDITTFTVQDEVIDDALAAVNLLQGTEGINPQSVFVIGHSLGAMLAPRIAQQAPDLAGIVLLAAPGRSLIDVSLEQFDYLGTLPENQVEEAQAVLEAYREELNAAAQIDESTDLNAVFFGAPTSYWLDLQNYSQVQVAQGLSLPMLILQGARDYQVTMEDFAGWREALEDAPNVTFRSYPALNHLFLAGEGPSVPAEYNQPGHVPGEVINDLVNWIREHAQA